MNPLLKKLESRVVKNRESKSKLKTPTKTEMLITEEPTTLKLILKKKTPRKITKTTKRKLDLPTIHKVRERVEPESLRKKPRKPL